MRNLIPDLERLMAGGTPLGRGVVTSVWGSAPEPEGAVLLATADGRMAGSVCGGCVEGAVVEEIQAAIGRGSARLLSYGVSEEKAWSVGLACGGSIRILVEPAVRPELLPLLRRRVGIVLATVLADEGGAVLVSDDGASPRILPAFSGDEISERNTPVRLSPLLPEILSAANASLEAESSRTADIGGLPFFLEVIPRPPRLIIFGAGGIAAELVPMARRVGFETIVADGREAFLQQERFPDAHRLILGWPDAVFNEIGIDQNTHICLLSHDPKFDEPALRIALKSSARYIGAIGSRKTQAARRERLLAEGFSESDLARIHGPIGLDIGGRRPAETALAVLGEVVKVRYGK
ncbi:MAG TPA: XdhC family protein [Gemmatimonadales bacterium]|nr:XdhC family protein [Gemmatimonadales bacterium]